MTTICSYFNPYSEKHRAMQHFKQLSCLQKAGISCVITCVALSIILIPFVVPVFRLLVERCYVQKKLEASGTPAQITYKNSVKPPLSSAPLNSAASTTTSLRPEPTSPTKIDVQNAEATGPLYSVYSFGDQELEKLINCEKKRDLYKPPSNCIPAELIGCRYLLSLCSKKGNWDLSLIFPQRTWTKAAVNKLNIDELQKLKVSQFLAIIDLISGDQALQLIQSDIHPSLKNGLFYFNSDFAIAYVRHQQKLYRASIDNNIQIAAQKLFSSLKKYDSQQMEEFQKNPTYAKLDEQRIASSNTLTGRSVGNDGLERGPVGPHQNAWTKVNQLYLAKGLQGKLTKAFIIDINRQLREPVLQPVSQERGPEASGIRQAHEEVMNAYEERYYTPGSGVELEITEAIRQINEAITACEKGNNNPISVAAEAYQKLVSIHGCYDGNGRTSRFIADLILRRFHLLPAAWTSDTTMVNVAIHPFSKNSPTPTTAVQSMMKAIENAYTFVAQPPSVDLFRN